MQGRLRTLSKRDRNQQLAVRLQNAEHFIHGDLIQGLSNRVAVPTEPDVLNSGQSYNHIKCLLGKRQIANVTAPECEIRMGQWINSEIDTGDLKSITS